MKHKMLLIYTSDETIIETNQRLIHDVIRFLRDNDDCDAVRQEYKSLVDEMREG